MQISARQIETFATDGVIALRNALTPTQLQQCETAWNWSCSNPGPAASGLLPESTHAFQDLCNPKSLAVYSDLVSQAPFADYAQSLWQSNAVWFMYEQVFHKTNGDVGATPWHQDTSYLAVGGQHLIAFWVAFEHIPRDCALEFVRGSHRGPLYNTSRFDPQDPTLPIVADPGVPDLPAIESDRAAWDILSFDLEPGDIVAFHTSTLHGGGPVNATTPERRTLTLRFFGDDAVSESRPGPAGPFFDDIRLLKAGEPFRHPRFLQVR